MATETTEHTDNPTRPPGLLFPLPPLSELRVPSRWGDGERPQREAGRRSVCSVANLPRRISYRCVRRPRFCNRWKLGRPSSLCTTTSPSRTKSSYGSVSTACAISGKTVVRPCPLRERRCRAKCSRTTNNRSPPPRPVSKGCGIVACGRFPRYARSRSEVGLSVAAINFKYYHFGHE